MQQLSTHNSWASFLLLKTTQLLGVEYGMTFQCTGNIKDYNMLHKYVSAYFHDWMSLCMEIMDRPCFLLMLFD